MIAEHFTRRWQRAGLIDGALAERIVAWEAAHRRPVVLWAVAGMGALAVSLGVMAIVSANWENIPAAVKLATMLGLNGLCAVAVFVFWRRDWAWRREIAALLLFGLVLSGIALIGQVYQLQSAPWRALTLWLVLATPFLAFTALSRLAGTIWAVAAVVTWFMADAPLQDLFVQLGALNPRPNAWDLSYMLPLQSYIAACLMIVIAALRGLWPAARSQADLLLRLALAGMIAACSLTLAFAWRPRDGAASLGPIVLTIAASLPAAAALWFGRPPGERRMLLVLLVGSLVAWACAVLLADSGRGGDVVRAVLFIVYWATIGVLAGQAGWRGTFLFAFTMIALRILVLYFEAIGGLTATGLGLIGGGILCLVLAAIGWQLSRGVGRRAPGAAA
jgi:uncharacterized membrane protein